jgi:hypothetical protein
MVPTMNPFMTGAAGFLMNKSVRDEFAAQFFTCEQFNPANRRRPVTSMSGSSTGSLHTRTRLPGGRVTWPYGSAKRYSISPVSVSLVAAIDVTLIRCR